MYVNKRHMRQREKKQKCRAEYSQGTRTHIKCSTLPMERLSRYPTLLTINTLSVPKIGNIEWNYIAHFKWNLTFYKRENEA